jgi:hypothetical protein
MPFAQLQLHSNTKHDYLAEYMMLFYLLFHYVSGPASYCPGLHCNYEILVLLVLSKAHPADLSYEVNEWPASLYDAHQ